MIIMIEFIVITLYSNISDINISNVKSIMKRILSSIFDISILNFFHNIVIEILI